MNMTLSKRLAVAVLVTHTLAGAAMAEDIVWSTPGTGFWDDVTNWPGGVLPTAADNVTVDIGSTTAVLRQLPGAPASPLSRFTVGSLTAKSPFEHAGGSLLVGGDATFEEAFKWSGGVLHVDATIPSGTWTFKKGLHFTASDLVGMNAGAMELQGHSILDGAVGVLLGSVPVHIASGATLEIRSGGQFVVQDNFVNDGLIDRTAGTDTFTISLRSGGNQGVVRNRTGVLNLLSTFDAVTHTGAFSVDTGAELSFQGAQTFAGEISGQGNVVFSEFRDFIVAADKFALDGTLTLQRGAKGVWNGDGTIQNLRLNGANFLPQGNVDVINRARVDAVSIVNGAPGSRVRFQDGLALQANFIVNGGQVELGGDTVVAGDVGLSVGSDATLTVMAGGSLRLTNDATPSGAGAIIGSGTFVNKGLVERDTGTGEFQFNVLEFINEGRLALESGRASAAVDFRQTADGTLAIELGSMLGPFAVGGDASLDGLLEISFANGFLPTLGQRFELMTFGTRTGDFTLATAGEAARPGYAYLLHYGPNALDIEITGLAPPVTAVPLPPMVPLFMAALGLLVRRGRRSPGR